MLKGQSAPAGRQPRTALQRDCWETREGTSKVNPTEGGQNTSPGRLLFKQRAQAREKLCFADGFLQDGRGLDRQPRRRFG